MTTAPFPGSVHFPIFLQRARVGAIGAGKNFTS